MGKKKRIQELENQLRLRDEAIKKLKGELHEQSQHKTGILLDSNGKIKSRQDDNTPSPGARIQELERQLWVKDEFIKELKNSLRIWAGAAERKESRLTHTPGFKVVDKQGNPFYIKERIGVLERTLREHGLM